MNNAGLEPAFSLMLLTLLLGANIVCGPASTPTPEGDLLLMRQPGLITDTLPADKLITTTKD